MKRVRLICVGMPVLLICLVWMNRGLLDSRFQVEKGPPQVQKGEIPKKVEIVWEAPEDFQEWLEEYRRSDERMNLDDGLTLALKRRVTMKHLIETDPEEALRMAVSEVDRVGLPEEIIE